MIKISTLMPLPAVVVLAACGGSSGQFGVIDPLNTTLNANDETVSIANDNVAFTLARDESYDRGTFIAGAEANGEPYDQVLALSETDDTFAALLRSGEVGAAPDLFIGRRTPVGTFPSGTATLTGTYVGNLDDENFGRLYIAGETTLEVDFDSLTLSGAVQNRTVPIWIGNGRLLFTMSTSFILEEAPLKTDGTFAGEITVIERTLEDEVTVLENSGNFEGMLGGANASEGVGVISANGETGVFAAGHE